MMVTFMIYEVVVLLGIRLFLVDANTHSVFRHRQKMTGDVNSM